jgi:hypothetical protein
MEELKEMGIVIFELSSVLENIQVETLSPEEKKRLFVLEYIYDDISNYLEKVFNENVKNVHYLEDSLRSSVMQLKGETNTSSQEDSDDFELF